MKGRFFDIGIYLAALVTLADQASKWWILENVLTDVRRYRVNDFFNFTLSWNKGVTFGMFTHYGAWMPVILTVVAMAIVLLLLNWLRRVDTFYGAFGLGFVLGGALGNVIDRLRYGAVVDFLDFHIGSAHWYTFNLADSAIVTGVFLLLLENWTPKPKKR